MKSNNFINSFNNPKGVELCSSKCNQLIFNLKKVETNSIKFPEYIDNNIHDILNDTIQNLFLQCSKECNLNRYLKIENILNNTGVSNLEIKCFCCALIRYIFLKKFNFKIKLKHLKEVFDISISSISKMYNSIMLIIK